MTSYNCVECNKPNETSVLRCTNCGALHNLDFELQKYHLRLLHQVEKELLVEDDVTERELINILNLPNLTEEQTDKLIESCEFDFGFLKYEWTKIN